MSSVLDIVNQGNISPKSKSKSPNKNKEKNKNYDEKCSKLEIKLTYSGRTETIYLDNKKTISFLSENVYNIFYPIQGKFQLLFRNKDISPFEDIPLYKYFKNLMKVSIVIKPLTYDTKNIKNSKSSILNSILDETIINKSEISGLVNQSQLNSSFIDKNKLICNECHKNLLNSFCRNCNMFLCEECAEKYSSPHRDHLIISVNISQIGKSANSYKLLVNKECYLTEKKFDEYKNDNDKLIEETKDKNKELKEWVNQIKTKVDEITTSVQKNEEKDINYDINLQNMDNDYEFNQKKLNKINDAKNEKGIKEIFKEMYEIDDNMKKIDNNLDQYLNNLECSKNNDKILKELNNDLDKVINKLVKDMENSSKNRLNNSENSNTDETHINFENV